MYDKHVNLIQDYRYIIVQSYKRILVPCAFKSIFLKHFQMSRLIVFTSVN
ncbi:hypothetical protein HanRHA438_Chr10g0445871 [Helianthus annuus]|nr:hypothetical protein HanRHA438_Chr10g0445871 [Helianthus annuus]